jgi:hypothetical protein
MPVQSRRPSERRGPLIQRQCACGGGCARCKEAAAPPGAASSHPGASRHLLDVPLHSPGPEVTSAPRVAAADDASEREADRVAGEVMAVSHAVSARETPGPHLAREREAGSSISAGGAWPLAARAMASSGKPLDHASRAFFEPRFGRAFGDIRVHEGADAERSADALGAAAYTFGSSIVFNRGRYVPGSAEGRRLLAHELAHVVQQGPASAAGGMIHRQLYPPIPIVICRRRRRRIPSGTATPNTGITVSWSGNEIEIDARLEISGPNASQAVADALKDDIEARWNAAFSDGYSSTCTVDVSLRSGDPDPSAAPVNVGNCSPDQSSVMGGTMNLCVQDPEHLVWSPSHEFAHLLGLDDMRSGPIWDLFGMMPETSDPGYENNIMGAIPDGDYSRREELVVESRNIRDWLRRFATVSELDCGPSSPFGGSRQTA